MADIDDLRQRLEVLEATVAGLARSLRILQEAVLREDLAPEPEQPPISPTPASDQTTTVPDRPSQQPAPVSAPETPPPLRPVSAPKTDWLQNWELWLNRLGIGLLLLGIAFLFKYAIDLGWLTDGVLVAIGLLMATGLIALGWRLQQRAIFSQFLQGGGLATYYITGFAAYQLDVVSMAIAFPLMVAVTLAAFFLALRQNRAIFSVIGTLGGLATPFLLYEGSGSPLALAAYTFVIVAGSWGIYAYKGWRSLLWSSFWLGWLVLSIAVNAFNTNTTGLAPWFLQAILGLTWLGFTVLPPWYQWGDRDSASLPHGQALALFNPLITLSLSAVVWNWSATTVGAIFIAFGALYLVTSLLWRRIPLSWRWVYSLTGLLLILAGIIYRYHSNPLMLAPLAIEGLILHYLAQYYRSASLRTIAHVWWGILTVVMAARFLILAAGTPPLLNREFITDLIVMAAGLGSTRFLAATTRPVYWVFGYALTLGWIQHELASLGTGAATLLWGLFGVGLLVYGLRRDVSGVRIVALITLIITIIRLFIIDLINLAPVWRVLLFMGFGLIFLVLSYFFRALWRHPPTESSRISENTDPVEPKKES
ncbi:DUF2339 domain-containing protein [Parathermosynechococcus lividus]